MSGTRTGPCRRYIRAHANAHAHASLCGLHSTVASKVVGSSAHRPSRSIDQLTSRSFTRGRTHKMLDGCCT